LNYGINTRTIRNWKKEFSRQGLRGLERKSRSDKGKYRWVPQELVELTKALTLHKPPLTISFIHRKVSQEAIRKLIQPISYRTVYNIVKKVSPALITLAHEGSKVYNQKYELIYRRECHRANEIWQADHTLLDLYLMDPKGKERKPWLTIIIDDYSRAICGYYLSFDAPCALHTALSLRQAIWRKGNPNWPICGIPQSLYTDHGSDFMSLHIEQVCICLKIGMINSMIGRPQGRGKIERFFDTINERLLQQLPGYSIKGKATSNPSLDFKTFEELLQKFILEEYHHTTHTTLGETPLKKWGGDGFLPQLPESLEELDLLLLYVEKPRKVQRDGIRFSGLRYIAPTLAGFVGESVTIRYEPRDLAEIRVYHQEKFLCNAICQEIAEMEVSLKEIQKARRGVKKDLYLEIKKAKVLLSSAGKEPDLLSNSSHALPKPSKHISSIKRYENE
jgi:putative transposase